MAAAGDRDRALLLFTGNEQQQDIQEIERERGTLNHPPAGGRAATAKILIFWDEII